MANHEQKTPGAHVHREANVLLELRVQGAMSEEVLDANSDAILDAVQRHGSDVALGPTVSLNMRDLAIRLRFDAFAPTEATVHRTIADVLQIIEEHTDIVVVRSRSETEVEDEDDAALVC